MRLSEEQLDAFLTDGFVVLRPGTLDHNDHDFFYRRAADLYETARITESPTAHLDILGDNLRAQIPAVDRLLADPVIDGALTSVLGADYVVHPHSYCHRSSQRDQPFHQDGNLPWNERGHYRSHRPDWAMLFYYPQAVDHRNGPTEVVPGSHYWTIDHERPDGGWYSGDRLARSTDDDVLGDAILEHRDAALQRSLDDGLAVSGLTRRFLHLPAGSVVLAHYDLVHRGSRATDGPDPRFMYKFYFARVRSPEPTTDIGPRTRTAAAGSIKPIVAANHRWLAGLEADGERRRTHHHDGDSPAATQDEIDFAVLAKQLGGDKEDLRIASAYQLGHMAASGDRHALETLGAALYGKTESVRRAAGHGLRQAGSSGVPVLVKGLDSEAAPVRRPAAAGLGTTVAAASAPAVAALIRVMADDPDSLVRSNAAYSLGQVGRSSEIDPNSLVDALLDRLAPGAEPDNAFNAAFARSTVRQSAAYGLLQVLANHSPSAGRLQRIVVGLDTEPDRYVQGLLVEGLARTDRLPRNVRRRLIGLLAGRRWNPSSEADQLIDPTTRLR